MIANLAMKFWLTVLRTDPRTKHLLSIDNAQSVLRNHNSIQNGLSLDESSETADYSRQHKISDGIERIVYLPKERKFKTPILMTHGMWHGAWCWESWMKLFATWGWACYSYSLPAHGQSPEQVPIRDCTLDYYASFLRNEVERLDTLPVLMGHSMGGAISQWYLKYVRDDVPATVLVASWVSHTSMLDGFIQFMKIDPLGVLKAYRVGDASPYIRNPEVAAKKLISKGAILSPEELHAQLVSESSLVIMQHNPPLWTPKQNVQSPMLYLAGEIDTVISNGASRKTAEHYGADFVIVEQAAHNLMMEHNYQETAQYIHQWLGKQLE